MTFQMSLKLGEMYAPERRLMGDMACPVCLNECVLETRFLVLFKLETWLLMLCHVNASNLCMFLVLLHHSIPRRGLQVSVQPFLSKRQEEETKLIRSSAGISSRLS